MAKRHPNHRLVKIHRNYTVAEIADLFHVHKNTVRLWITDGLPTCDHRRPTLVVGHHLAAFLWDRRVRKKQPCGPGRLYCIRCRLPKIPAGGLTNYLPITEKTGNLSAICPDCDSMMYRRVSLASLSVVLRTVQSLLAQERELLINSYQPTLNSVLREERVNDATQCEQ